MDTIIHLTCREAEVLHLLARGCTYIQVGDRLRMSVHTVESHVKNVYRKLNVHSARAAVWRATELGMLGGAIGVAPEATT
jgi:ATP/maltotriose-dependent transcriptional regulator MalT